MNLDRVLSNFDLASLDGLKILHDSYFDAREIARDYENSVLDKDSTRLVRLGGDYVFKPWYIELRERGLPVHRAYEILLQEPPLSPLSELELSYYLWSLGKKDDGSSKIFEIVGLSHRVEYRVPRPVGLLYDSKRKMLYFVEKRVSGEFVYPTSDVEYLIISDLNLDRKKKYFRSSCEKIMLFTSVSVAYNSLELLGVNGRDFERIGVERSIGRRWYIVDLEYFSYKGRKTPIRRIGLIEMFKKDLFYCDPKLLEIEDNYEIARKIIGRSLNSRYHNNVLVDEMSEALSKYYVAFP